MLAVEPLPTYIAFTKTFKLGLFEEAGGWQKNARRVNSTSVPLFVQCRASSKRRSCPLGGRPPWLLEREGLASEDLKRVGALMPLGQKRAVWIRTGNLSLIKHNALTTEPWLRIWDINCRNIAVYVVELQKRKLWTSVVAARQLWCWVPQWRYDLGTLIKCVCKALIYHPPKSQHSIMIWHCCSRLWMLWGSAPQESENVTTLGWLIGHNWSIYNIRMVLEKCMNWLQNTLSSSSITSVIWELHPSPSTCWLEPALSSICWSLWNVLMHCVSWHND